MRWLLGSSMAMLLSGCVRTAGAWEGVWFVEVPSGGIEPLSKRAPGGAPVLPDYTRQQTLTPGTWDISGQFRWGGIERLKNRVDIRDSQGSVPIQLPGDPVRRLLHLPRQANLSFTVGQQQRLKRRFYDVKETVRAGKRCFHGFSA